MSGNISADESNTERLTLETLSDKFVTREICALREKKIDDMQKAITDSAKEIAQLRLDTMKGLGEINESMASMAEWMKQHQEAHKGGWTKTHTIAVVAAALFSSLSLIVATAVAVITFLH